MSTIFKYLLSTALIVQFIQGQTPLTPVSIGTAGTQATQVRGSDVIGWNPANLGYANNPNFSLTFGLLPFLPFPAMEFENSTFSAAWYNEYLFNKGLLSHSDISDLLDSFPADGIELGILIDMNIIGISYKNFAVKLSSIVNTRINFPKELISLPFEGIRFDEPIDLKNLSVSMSAIVPVSFAYGMELPISVTDYVDKVFIGTAVKLLTGAAYMELGDFEGQIISQKDQVKFRANGVMKTAASGTGLGLDAGIAVKVNDHLNANFTINNIVGFINWSGDEAEQTEFSVDTAYHSFDYDSDLDSLYADIGTDTTYSIDGFTTNYPTHFIVGVEYSEILPALDIFINYRQYFVGGFPYGKRPRVSIGALFDPLKWLPLRMGISMGGSEGFQLGYGFGLHAKRYHFDFGFSQNHGIFNNAKGFSFGIGGALLF